MKKKVVFVRLAISALSIVLTFAVIKYISEKRYSCLGRVGNYGEKSTIMVGIVHDRNYNLPDHTLVSIAYLMGENDITYRTSGFYILEKNIHRWSVFASAMVNMLNYYDQDLTEKIESLFKMAGPNAKEYLLLRLAEEKAKAPGDERLRGELIRIINQI